MWSFVSSIALVTDQPFVTGGDSAGEPTASSPAKRLFKKTNLIMSDVALTQYTVKLRCQAN